MFKQVFFGREDVLMQIIINVKYSDSDILVNSMENNFLIRY